MDVDNKAEELASALGVDKQEVKADLESLLEFDVPLEEAAQSVRRKHGGGGGGSSTPETLDLDGISTAQDSVNVTVRVLTQGTRTIRYQGEDVTIREGKLADASGTISYTAWQDFGFEPGDSIVIGNAGVREWDGRPELNLGQSTTVSMADETVDVDQSIGGDSDLIDLEPGDRGRNVEVRVQEVDSRTIDGRDGETTILSGVLADETARLPFTDWDPHPDLETGADLRIEDVYIREFRGSPSVNLSEFSTVEPLSEPVVVTDSAPQLSLAEAVDSGGLFDVEVVGNVLEVRDGSGLIERCPDCGRVIQNNQCRTHGEVEGEDDLRIKAILDDGTDTVTAIIGSELTAEIYGGDVADAKEAARDAMDKEVVAETIRERLVGNAYRVRGSLSVDEYGPNLNVEAFDAADEDPAALATAALAEVRQ
ncbi:MAG: Single-stranded DNA binding protein [Euryarchaeota archaeon]|nr:Single-stranded DNA binding protein [Euryarchaeota archaeon]